MPNYTILLLLLLMTGTVVAQKKLPSVWVENSTGQIEELAKQTNKEGYTIVSFWATWCKPCLKELDVLKEKMPSWQAKTDVQLLAISTDDSRTKGRVPTIFKAKNWPAKLFFDTNGDAQRVLQVLAIPHTFILNKHNEIVYQHTSFVLGDELLYEKIIVESTHK